MAKAAGWVAALAIALSSPAAFAKEWFVAPGGSGNGEAASPFGQIQAGIDAAQPGDVINVAAGTYAESLVSQRAGSASAPITLRGASGGAKPLLQMQARLLTVSHAYFVVENLSFDGQYVNDDLIRVADAATGFTLRGCDVMHATKDCIDLGAPADVVIEGSSIHHCLNSANGQTDAHGVVGGAVKNFSIKNSEIHSFSGDAVQFDPARALPGWSELRIEGCKLWTGPLPQPENGFAAGAVPGENAVDTKTNAGAPRATLTIVDTEAWGFRNGFISNMAAFNIKENVDVVFDRVTVRESEIAFRVRFPAWVRIQNAVVFDVQKALRYEDGIENVRLFSSTFGRLVQEPFVAASSASSVLDIRNLLVLGSLPALATDASNRAVDESAFVSASSDDYHLVPGASPIDQGVSVAEVTADRDGVPRPQGAAFDVGAYELCTAGCGGTGGTSGAGGAPGGGSANGGSANAGQGGASGANTAADSGDEGGCGCRVNARNRGTGLFVMVSLLSLLMRRQRSS